MTFRKSLNKVYALLEKLPKLRWIESKEQETYTMQTLILKIDVAGMAILISYKVDSRAKEITREKFNYCINIKGQSKNRYVYSVCICTKQKSLKLYDPN